VAAMVHQAVAGARPCKPWVDAERDETEEAGHGSVVAVVATDLVADDTPFLERDDAATEGSHHGSVVGRHQDRDASSLIRRQELDESPS